MRELLLAAETIKALEWRNGVLYILDQRVLPDKQIWVECYSSAQVAEAIRALVIRGTSAVAICAAYAVVMSARSRIKQGGDWLGDTLRDIEQLEAARPSVFYLLRVLNYMRQAVRQCFQSSNPIALLEAEAIALHQRDREANLSMSELGVELIRRQEPHAQSVMTHGNAGALATGGFGTALGVIRAAWRRRLIEQVYTDETRPLLLGSRLTAWELAEDGIPVTVVADSAAAHLMKTRAITWLILGADRVAANGDVLGKIGSYQLAVTAMHHGVRVMVVASSVSIDLQTPHGDEFILEERAAGELLEPAGGCLEGEVAAFNPLFDVTPADLIDFIVTERGLVDRPDSEKMALLMCRKRLH